MSNRKLNLTSIEHALTVAEHLSFRRAAEAMGISQSSISKRIAALEDMVGVALFERHHSGVRVTDAGQRFFRHVRSALDHLDEASRVAGRIGRVETGHLRIGISSSLASGFLPFLIHTFSTQHPEVRIVVEDCAASDCFALLRDRRFDLVFTIGDVDARDFESQRFWSERIFIALPDGHPLCQKEMIGWAELADAETIILNRSASRQGKYDEVVRRWTAINRTLDIHYLSVARDTLMHLVGLGWGISLTTEAAIAVPFPGVVFRPLADEDHVLRFSGVWLSQNNNQALRRVIAIARVLSQEQSR